MEPDEDEEKTTEELIEEGAEDDGFPAADEVPGGIEPYKDATPVSPGQGDE